MAPKSKILKLIAAAAFLWLLIIILMNIFISGHSYYYSRLEHQLKEKQNSNLLNKEHNEELEKFWQNNGDNHYNIDLLADIKATEPPTEELLQQFEQELPNVPFAYFYKHRKLDMEKFKNCAEYPAIQILNYHNNYWQTFRTRNITFQLYGAYYDERQAVVNGPVLRILAMINQMAAPFPTIYCQIWFENDLRPQITTIALYKFIWNDNWGGHTGMYFPYLLTCDIPKTANITGDRIPRAVTIVEHQCDTAGNTLKVIYDKPPQNQGKLPFAVCVKGLDFPYADISVRLVEWLEMLRLLGAHKVFFYHIATHPNVTKVLDYYQQQNFVKVQPISLVGGVVALPELEHWLLKPNVLNKRLNELIPYNDCFYRNIYKYYYIAVLDIDEIIMPMGNLTSWHDLVDKAKQNAENCPNGFAGICVPNVYFPFAKDTFIVNQTSQELEATSDVPSYMFMLQHQYRVKNHLPPGFNTKCLQNTEQALTLHNHYALSWLKSCKPLDLPNTVAHLQHYHDLKPDAKNSELILDKNIERFKKPLIDKCTKVLKELGFLR